MLSRRTFLITGGVAAVGAGAFFAAPQVLVRPAEAAGAMTAQEAAEAAAAGEILIVDVRRPDEWAATGIPKHGVGIDMRDADFLAQLAALRPTATTPVALICARGVRSARMTRRLEEAGIAPIIDIPEGMLGSSAGPGWVARGLPVTVIE